MFLEEPKDLTHEPGTGNLGSQPSFQLARGPNTAILRMGPGLASGEDVFVPFTVNTGHLFQEYLVACLKRHAPPRIAVSPQYHIEFNTGLGAHFDVDVVLTDESTKTAIGVAEAKYKADNKIRSSDIQQAVAYAALTDSPAAFLVYPYDFSHSSKGPSGPRNVSNSLDSDFPWIWMWVGSPAIPIASL